MLVLLIAGSAAIWLISRKTAVDRHNVNEMPEVEVLGEYRTKKERKQALKERRLQKQGSSVDNGGAS